MHGPTKSQRQAFNLWMRGATITHEQPGILLREVLVPDEMGDHAPTKQVTPVYVGDADMAERLQVGLQMGADAATDVAHMELKLGALLPFVNADAVCWPVFAAPAPLIAAYVTAEGADAKRHGLIWRITPSLAELMRPIMQWRVTIPDPQNSPLYVVCWGGLL